MQHREQGITGREFMDVSAQLAKNLIILPANRHAVTHAKIDQILIDKGPTAKSGLQSILANISEVGLFSSWVPCCAAVASAPRSADEWRTG